MGELDTESCLEVSRGSKFVLTGQKGTRRSPSVICNPVKQVLDAVLLEVDDWKLVLQWLPRSVKLEVVDLYDCNVGFRAFDNLIISPFLKSLLTDEATIFWYKQSSSIRHTLAGCQNL